MKTSLGRRVRSTFDHRRPLSAISGPALALAWLLFAGAASANVVTVEGKVTEQLIWEWTIPPVFLGGPDGCQFTVETGPQPGESVTVIFYEEETTTPEGTCKPGWEGEHVSITAAVTWSGCSFNQCWHDQLTFVGNGFQWTPDSKVFESKVYGDGNVVKTEIFNLQGAGTGCVHYVDDDGVVIPFRFYPDAGPPDQCPPERDWLGEDVNTEGYVVNFYCEEDFCAVETTINGKGIELAPDVISTQDFENGFGDWTAYP